MTPPPVSARRLVREQLRAHRRVLVFGAVAGIAWQAAAALAPLALGRVAEPWNVPGAAGMLAVAAALAAAGCLRYARRDLRA